MKDFRHALSDPIGSFEPVCLYSVWFERLRRRQLGRYKLNIIQWHRHGRLSIQGQRVFGPEWQWHI